MAQRRTARVRVEDAETYTGLRYVDVVVDPPFRLREARPFDNLPDLVAFWLARMSDTNPVASEWITIREPLRGGEWMDHRVPPGTTGRHVAQAVGFHFNHEGDA